MFDPGKPFQPSLMFVDKARSHPLRGSPEICFTQVGSGLTHKHYTSLEKLAKDKDSRLLQTFVNYACKKF